MNIDRINQAISEFVDADSGGVGMNGHKVSDWTPNMAQIFQSGGFTIVDLLDALRHVEGSAVVEAGDYWVVVLDKDAVWPTPEREGESE